MRIGLLSDSHGRAGMTRAAVAVLLREGAEMLIHLGDVCGEAVIDELVAAGQGEKEQVEVRLVFGNCDADVGGMSRYARGLGLKVDHPVGRLALGDGRVLVFTHGDDQGTMMGALEEGVAYLCHGHTHVARDQRHGRTRVVNPGALFRAAEHTVAVLDTDSDEVTFYKVKGK